MKYDFLQYLTCANFWDKKYSEGAITEKELDSARRLCCASSGRAATWHQWGHLQGAATIRSVGPSNPNSETVTHAGRPELSVAGDRRQNGRVDLPVTPPVRPMLSKAVTSIPPGASYEPKWDGFRSICFRDGDDVELGSRNERPMTRYFPELVAAAKAELPPRCVIDGEIVVAAERGLDFEALQQRIHPADSRVRMLAERTPASFMAFCVRAVNDQPLARVSSWWGSRSGHIGRLGHRSRV